MLNPFETPKNSEVLIERIKARMDALGLNPSSVALEADLGRSAVRDILSGKAKSPKHVTLYKIADVLKCSASYLIGDIDTLFPADDPNRWVSLDQDAWQISSTLEAGVYRRKIEQLDFLEEDNDAITGPQAFQSGARFIGQDLALYQVGDDSLGEINIIKGDTLTVLLCGEDKIDLRDGQLLVVLHSPMDIKEHELSARQVHVVEGKTQLVTRSTGKTYRPITLNSVDLKVARGDELETIHGDKVKVIGRAVSLSRDFKL